MVLRSKVHKQGRKPTTVKWIYKPKIELDGRIRFKCQLDVQGYSQIPGLDYTESFSLIASKTAIYVMFGTALYYEWGIEMFDVEATFLNEKCPNETFIKWPEGAIKLGFIDKETQSKYCIMFNNSMYGTVDAAILWMKDISEYLKEMSMEQSQTDPCIFFKQENKKLVLILAVYVDDTLVAGTTKAKK